MKNKNFVKFDTLLKFYLAISEVQEQLKDLLKITIKKDLDDVELAEETFLQYCAIYGHCREILKGDCEK
jgi:hypothetical protein